MSIRMIPSIRNFILKCLFLCMAMGLVSCSNGTLPELYIESVSIYTDPDANQNSATAVDLVIIYDEELVKILGHMSAAKYFASSRQLLLDNPTLLDIWHWELVPGQIVQDFSPPQEEGDSYAAFVFANYITPGDHRIKVSPEGVVKILLMKNDLKNLAVYDLHEARVGTTMSNATETTRELDSVRDLGLCKIKLGPTEDRINPCKRMGPKTTPICQQAPPCPPNFRPCQRQPILTKPLGPPLSISPQPCGNYR
jgi:type VI secretion system protein